MIYTRHVSAMSAASFDERLETAIIDLQDKQNSTIRDIEHSVSSSYNPMDERVNVFYSAIIVFEN